MASAVLGIPAVGQLLRPGVFRGPPVSLTTTLTKQILLYFIDKTHRFFLSKAQVYETNLFCFSAYSTRFHESLPRVHEQFIKKLCAAQ